MAKKLDGPSLTRAGSGVRNPYFALPAGVIALLVAAGAISCNRQMHAENGLEFRAWFVVPPIVAGSGSVAYGHIRNTSAVARTLQEVKFSCAEASELHETLTDNGRARMLPLGKPTIQPGESIIFEPSHKHIMLMKVNAASGAACPVEFTFDSGTVRFVVPVREMEHTDVRGSGATRGRSLPEREN